LESLGLSSTFYFLDRDGSGRQLLVNPREFTDLVLIVALSSRYVAYCNDIICSAVQSRLLPSAFCDTLRYIFQPFVSANGASIDTTGEGVVEYVNQVFNSNIAKNSGLPEKHNIGPFDSSTIELSPNALSLFLPMCLTPMGMVSSCEKYYPSFSGSPTATNHRNLPLDRLWDAPNIIATKHNPGMLASLLGVCDDFCDRSFVESGFAVWPYTVSPSSDEKVVESTAFHTSFAHAQRLPTPLGQNSMYADHVTKEQASCLLRVLSRGDTSELVRT
jgi:hypothetical protein